MPKLVKMYNSGNSAVGISKVVYFGYECLENVRRKSSGVNMTLISVVTPTRSVCMCLCLKGRELIT